MEGQPVFPRVQRGRGNESGLPCEGCGLPDNEACLAAEAGDAKVFRPVEAGGVGGKVGLLPCVVRLVDVLLIRQRDMFFGDSALQFDDVLGADVRVSESGEFEQSRNVRLIFGLEVAHARTVGKVVFAVGHFQAALQQVGGIVLGVVKAGSDP